MTPPSFCNSLSTESPWQPLCVVAIGYTMVYGILRLINFAHGDVLMMGCYFAFYVALIFSLPWWVSFPIAILLTALLAL